MQETTIAAIATAPGAGGIAVVRLSGAESYQVAARVFHPANPAKKVEEAKGYTALFGHFVDREESFDEGVALFFRAPHSYTGEDVVELSCHGGNAVARRLVEACFAAGAQPAAPGEYTRRAFLNGKLGLSALWHYWQARGEMRGKYRMLLFRIREEFRLLGRPLLLLDYLLEQARRHPEFCQVEGSWVLEDNMAVNDLIEDFSGRITKRYRLYRKEIVS